MSIARYLLVASVLVVSPVSLAKQADAGKAVRGVQIAQARFPLPPGDIPGEDNGPVIIAQDSSALVLRIDRLENQVRNLTGQIEQMQFEQRKLEESLRKSQSDAEARIADPAARPSTRAPAAPNRRPPSGDAFDPAANPNAPGVPRALGAPYGLPPAQTAVVEQPLRPNLPQGPIANGPGGINPPIELAPGAARAPRVADAPLAPAQRTVSASPVVIPGPPGTPALVPLSAQPLDDFDQGVSFYKQGQYADSETRLVAFLQKNPRDKLVPDAIFYLGESYYQRQRTREAAEQFLKISTDYSKSTRAPDALVRLGMSLNSMGAKEQACATFGEVSRKYPGAAAAIRGAGRESKRAQC